ncbi:coil containing protein [Vibrio phage 1.038.O._10N.286.51.C2]|nr:coil containing protein [Vibrio phage 1.038.O._10N.286.51.C2]
MKNKKVRARFEGVALECWNYFKWVDNSLVNGWMDYKDGDFLNGRDDQKYVSLTADQLRGKA